VETANALRKYGRSDEVSEEIDAIYSLSGVTVHELSNVDLRVATQIFETVKISPYDCAHAAVMKRVGLQTIISTDRDFDKIPGINRLDPLAKSKQ